MVITGTGNGAKTVTSAVMSVAVPASLLMKNESCNEVPGKRGNGTVWLIDEEVVVVDTSFTELIPVCAFSGGAVSTVTIPVPTQGESDPVSNPGFAKS